MAFNLQHGTGPEQARPLSRNGRDSWQAASCPMMPNPRWTAARPRPRRARPWRRMPEQGKLPAGRGYGTKDILCCAAAAYKTKLPDTAELVRRFHFEDYTGTLLKDLSPAAKKAFLITAFALKLELLLPDEPVNGLGFQGTEHLHTG